MILISIPLKFHKYLDNDYKFHIIDIIPTKEIELHKGGYRIAKFYQNKSCTFSDRTTIKIPESIFFETTSSLGSNRILVSKESHNDLFLAGLLLGESKLAGPRVHKYITLFRAYESLTKSKERDIYLSSIRHCLSHSAIQLTNPTVIKVLNELFGGLEIDLAQYRHKKEFYLSYWKLLKKVDSLLFNRIIALLPVARDFIFDLKIITA